MSVKVMSMIWDYFPLGGGERLTALCLADHADHDGGNIFPSIARVAFKTMQSDRTIQRHIATMKEIGWLVELRAGGQGPGSTTSYRIPIECLNLPVLGRVTKLHPSELRVTSEPKRVTPEVNKGDIAVSPELGLPVIKQPSSAFALPDWVPKESWEGWIEVRTKKKVPNTPRALKLAINTLTSLKAAGHDPRVVLDTATVRGWRGLFAPTSTPESGGSGWWDSNDSMLRKAQELKIGTTGLTTQQLRAKINERLAQPRAH